METFCNARKAFTDDEWMNLIIRTLGYEPTRYGEDEKMWLLCRLIPIAHNRINMMELAPPGLENPTCTTTSAGTFGSRPAR